MKTIPGICSHHPFFSRKHYPLIDIDAENRPCNCQDPHAGTYKIPTKVDIIKWLDQQELIPGKFTVTIEETPHGWHVYVWQAMTIGKAEQFLNSCPWIDKTYSKLGRKRGFWFLRTVQIFDPPVPVTFMAIRGGNWIKGKG